MNKLKRKTAGKLRRKMHIRRWIFGSAEKPRLSIFRSHQNISCQLIDDGRGVTLAACSSQSKDLRQKSGDKGGNRSAAEVVGQAIAERAKGLGIQSVAFDRNGYRFHGRVKALADAARKAGLKF
jgi:large subunit ribosomal protein L18